MGEFGVDISAEERENWQAVVNKALSIQVP
jgi:hypothetical protein